MGHITTFTLRIDMLDAITNKRGGENEVVKAITTLTLHMREANKIRNQYAHSSWTMVEGGYQMNIWENSVQRKTQTRVVTVDDAKKDAAKLRETLHHLISFTQNEVLPPMRT